MRELLPSRERVRLLERDFVEGEGLVREGRGKGKGKKRAGVKEGDGEEKVEVARGVVRQRRPSETGLIYFGPHDRIVEVDEVEAWTPDEDRSGLVRMKGWEVLGDDGDGGDEDDGDGDKWWTRIDGLTDEDLKRLKALWDPAMGGK